MKPILATSIGLLALAAACGAAHAQSISPIVVEYNELGEGKIELTNDTAAPLIVALQAQSFSIAPDGSAVYRPLDTGIHVELSTTSVRLEPAQNCIVSYKTHADALPAWYTIYATFAPPQRGPGLNLRTMLPHTVYLYQKESLQMEDVHIDSARYDAARKVVVVELENVSKSYGRMREGTVRGGRYSAPIGGFPLLPGSPRRVEIPWSGTAEPESIALHFDRFDLKAPVGESVPATTMAMK